MCPAANDAEWRSMTKVPSPHSGPTSMDTQVDANPMKVEAAPCGPTYRTRLILHHLFLLPVYAGVLIGALAGLAMAVGLVWLTVLIWGALADSYLTSHGWRYRPDELAEQDHEECENDQ